MRCPMAARPSLGFVVTLAWRETRGAGRHFAYLVACITLGVGALVAVSSFAASLERTVGRSARALMGGDVEIRSTQPLSPAAESVVSEMARGGIEVLPVQELVAMSAAREKSQIVELKTVARGYPFYGDLVTEPAASLGALVGRGRALVHPSLLQRLGASVGDRMKIGDADFVISGVIRQEPDRSVGVFSLGPRVMIAAEDLPSTGLVRPGSRVRHRVLFRLPPGANAEAFKDALAARLPDANVRVTTYSQAQPGVRRFWNQLTVYLGLTGLVALMVGGIGVATSVRAFVRGKLDTIAVLKCLGAGWRQMLAAYLLQTVLLGLGRDVEARLPGRRPWLAGLPIAAGLAALVFWQAGSFKVGGLFLGGLAGALALLGLTAQAVIAGARRLPRLRSLAWRHAVANVHRPG